MLLNLEEFETAEIRKIVSTINQYYTKGKLKKINNLDNLEDFIKDKNSMQCKEAVYIYSTLFEKIWEAMSLLMSDH